MSEYEGNPSAQPPSPPSVPPSPPSVPPSPPSVPLWGAPAGSDDDPADRTAPIPAVTSEKRPGPERQDRPGGQDDAGGWPPPPQHPAFPGQPVWGAPGPPRMTGIAKIMIGAVVVLALMAASAIAGGVVGAWVYSRQDDRVSGAPAGTTVVDGPQLDRTSLASIASQMQPSVVSITTGGGEGSGVIMSKDGHILTNNHVVATGRGNQVRVKFSNGETTQATVVGTDPRTDLAVVKVGDVSGLAPATFGDSDELLVGDTVLAIGSPLGFQGSVTQGIVSALDRALSVGADGNPFGGETRTSLSGLVQTDASINPGNSGGALVNLKGEVIGINTAIATSGVGAGNIGVGFAIPSNRARTVAEQLIAGEEVTHPYLGVRVTETEEGGALISVVDEGSPAEDAGLQEGDIIIGLGDRAVNDSNNLVSAVQARQVGDEVRLAYRRDGTERSTTVTLGEAPD